MIDRDTSMLQRNPQTCGQRLLLPRAIVEYFENLILIVRAGCAVSPVRVVGHSLTLSHLAF